MPDSADNRPQARPNRVRPADEQQPHPLWEDSDSGRLATSPSLLAAIAGRQPSTSLDQFRREQELLEEADCLADAIDSVVDSSDSYSQATGEAGLGLLESTARKLLKHENQLQEARSQVWRRLHQLAVESGIWSDDLLADNDKLEPQLTPNIPVWEDYRDCREKLDRLAKGRQLLEIEALVLLAAGPGSSLAGILQDLLRDNPEDFDGELIAQTSYYYGLEANQSLFRRTREICQLLQVDYSPDLGAQRGQILLSLHRQFEQQTNQKIGDLLNLALLNQPRNNLSPDRKKRLIQVERRLKANAVDRLIQGCQLDLVWAGIVQTAILDNVDPVYLKVIGPRYGIGPDWQQVEDDKQIGRRLELSLPTVGKIRQKGLVRFHDWMLANSADLQAILVAIDNELDSSPRDGYLSRIPAL